LENKNRTIEILENNFYEPLRNALSVPILKTVPANLDLSAKENIEGYFPVSAEKIGHYPCFMLRVTGESMSDAGIFHGDMALIRRQDMALNGDIAAVLLDGAVTVKTYYIEGDFVRLQPQSRLFDPIITDRAVVVGKVIGIFREL
jgi:repressor LexA